ncbi:DUF4160 domain-containing protein [Yoonia litorea]|uniref:DUF4160 domain-containing protein n=1 Tax=Yoonia litorea TaxID=1123755 RepID=A0A1I6MJ83_9RHOB|nr:DUF4160 domain-containing protein [Yoonia litorea]SFS15770.1 protein of unknown function [Yoonia litorea]
MPTVYRLDGYRFFFYSNEGDPREPVHIHVMKGGAEAKFWVRPVIRLERSYGFDARTLRKLARMIESNGKLISEAWDEHFGG